MFYPPSGAGVYQVSVPSGTYAGVHIMLSGLTPGKFVTFEADAPLRTTETVREDGTCVVSREPDRRWKLFELLPLPVEVNSGPVSRTEWMNQDVNQHVIRRAPFMVYDILRPCGGVVTAGSTVMALAFRCKVDSRKLLQPVSGSGTAQTGLAGLGSGSVQQH